MNQGIGYKRMSDRRKNLISYSVITAVTVLMIWRAKYGFIWSDEPYYFATAYRFVLGDIPVINDWNTGQVYSILLIPYMKLWKAITGTGFTGLFLGSRYLYVGLQTVCGLMFYRVFRKKSCIAALGGALVFMLYCRGGICTISYYSAGLEAVFASLIMIYRAVEQSTLEKIKASSEIKAEVKVEVKAKKQTKRNILSEFAGWIFVGTIWCIAIFCNPYIIILYVLLFAGIVALIRRTKLTDCHPVVMALTTAIMGILILTVVFKGTSINRVVESIQYIFVDESNFGTHSAAFKLVSGFLYVGYRFRYTIGLSALLIIYTVVLNIRKKREIAIKHINIKRLTMCIINTILLAVNVIYPAHSVYTEGTCMAALAVWGLEMYLLSEIRQKDVFYMFYLPGCVMALLMAAASNTGFSATTQGLTIAAAASILIGHRCIRDMVDKCMETISVASKKILVGIFVCAAIIVSFTYVYDRIIPVYRDCSLDKLSRTIEDGPAKGIITTDECADRYERISCTMNCLNKVIHASGSEVGNNATDSSLYVMNFCPWAYLLTDMRPTAYNMWRIMPKDDDNMGQLYYEIHPEKFPDVVLRLSYDNTEYDENTCNTLSGDGKNDTDQGLTLDRSWDNTKLMKQIKDKGYREINVECGTLYINNSDRYDEITGKSFGE